jgi:P63C domain
MSEEPTGRAKGGIARALVLSPERRITIASKAAAARWGEKPLRATHRGNFKDEFGIDVECYVLDDEQKTAVISQRGMSAALWLDPKSGASLPRFVKGEKIAPYVGGELREKLAHPLVFQWLTPVANVPPAAVHGYDVTILIDLCKAIIKAEEEGKLLKRQAHIAKQAHIILNASAKAGIKGLVYALAGYDATKEEVVAAFKFFVREEAREYEKEFPDQLYNEWYRLYQLPRPEKNKPWKFKHLTVHQVYEPLAKSSGKILELIRAMRSKGQEKHKKLHQFLSEVGVKALRTHLGQLLGIAQISEDDTEYERHVEKIFGRQTRFDFDK